MPTTATHLRQMFKDDRLLERCKAGELEARVASQNHPAAPLANEPFCTQSQLIEFYDRNNKRVATAHQYLRADGSIGLSGLPDPKEITHDGVRYYLDI